MGKVSNYEENNEQVGIDTRLHQPTKWGSDLTMNPKKFAIINVLKHNCVVEQLFSNIIGLFYILPKYYLVRLNLRT